MNVAEACRELAAHGLVPWSSGNASRRVYGEDYMFIKASGIRCSDVVGDTATGISSHVADVDLATGKSLHDIKPSTDSEAHRHIYNHLPEINGIVHTHSLYATAFAAAGKPIPCAMTMLEDEFGGDIPISAYCTIGDDSIGKEVVRLYRSTGVSACLIRHHGVFTVGPSLESAVKSAVLLEHCAQTAMLVMRMANPKVFPADQIRKNYDRYHGSYGQAA